MGIYIKGLKMPTIHEGQMIIRIEPSGKADVQWSGMVGGEYTKVVELPAHGDLMDRDAFIKVNREYLCKDCERRKGVKNGRKRTLYEIGGVPCRACGVEDMFEYLDDAPVVIPAERSEE